MSSENQYEKLTQQLEQHNVLSDAAEVQGILCGMLCGGMPLEDREWLKPLTDFIHQGEPLSADLQQHVYAFYNQICQQLLEAEFALQLCLPDDAAPINERGLGLINWVQGFMLGFGLHQADLTGCSTDVKEALEDFAEIARMDEGMPEDEESEKALFEVIEYVRITCMLCFNELGKSATNQQQTPNTLH